MWYPDDANKAKVELILAGQKFDPITDVAYTAETFTLKKLWNLHGHLLPIIIQVKEGYEGLQEFDAFSTGDVTILVFYV